MIDTVWYPNLERILFFKVFLTVYDNTTQNPILYTSTAIQPNTYIPVVMLQNYKKW